MNEMPRPVPAHQGGINCAASAPSPLKGEGWGGGEQAERPRRHFQVAPRFKPDTFQNPLSLSSSSGKPDVDDLYSIRALNQLQSSGPHYSPRMPTGRFAPSPTGEMHLGNLRTVLLAWLQARSQGGRFVLRFEDLDTGRVRQPAYQTTRDDLHWLGLDWDAEYRQSERRAVRRRPRAAGHLPLHLYPQRNSGQHPGVGGRATRPRSGVSGHLFRPGEPESGPPSRAALVRAGRDNLRDRRLDRRNALPEPAN